MQDIEIFRPGTFTSASGDKLTFGLSDLQAVADGYKPEDAPIVVGHPKHNAPAYGWVSGLRVDGDRLLATPHQVDPAFAEMVRAGRFRKISASFYSPEAEGNPNPGSYYLRHVGFLGAQAPAVKGLKPVEFATDATGTVTFEFGEYSDRMVARLFRQLREWMIGKHGQEEADKALPSFEVDALQDEAAREEPTAGVAFAETELSRLLNRLIDDAEGERSDIIDSMASEAGIERGTVNQILIGEISRPPDRRLRGFARALDVSFETLRDALPADDFSEPADQEEDMTKDADKGKADQEALQKQQADFAEQKKKHAEAVTELRKDKAAARIDRLIEAGKVAPGHKACLVEFMAGLDQDGEVIEFAEGEDGKSKKLSAAAFFDAFLDALPKQIDFGERSRPEGGDAGTADFAAPDGHTVDPQRAELHSRARAYQRQHPDVDYVTAVRAVERQ